MRPRSTRLAVAISLSVLLVLAGCTGGAPYEQAPDPHTAQQRHADALRDAGSYTYRTQLTTDTNVLDLGFSANSTARVELDPPAQYLNVSSGDSEVLVYAPADGPAYQRVRSGNTINYQRLDNQSVPPVNRTLRPGIANLTRAYDFTRNGTATVAGETTYVYEANTSTLNETTAGPFAEALADAEVVETTVRLYIRSDGLIKRISYRAVVSVGSAEAVVTYRITYVDVGSTDVEEPSWLEEAKETTG